MALESDGRKNRRDSYELAQGRRVSTLLLRENQGPSQGEQGKCEGDRAASPYRTNTAS